jgi:hypothetical protein
MNKRIAKKICSNTFRYTGYQVWVARLLIRRESNKFSGHGREKWNPHAGDYWRRYKELSRSYDVPF